MLQILNAPLLSPTASALVNATTNAPVPLDPKPSNHHCGIEHALQSPTAPSYGDVVHDEASHNEDSRRDTPPQQSSIVNLHHHNDSRLVEIRTANDPLLQENLERLLDDCRMNQGILSIVVVRLHLDKGAGLPNTNGELHRWQSEYIRVLEPLTEPLSISGFLSENGDLALVIQDIERSEMVQIVRDGFAELNRSMVASRSLATNRPTPFVAGISTVSGPSRSFAITQLIDAAWRCLDGAIVQGAGSVKSLEVF